MQHLGSSNCYFASSLLIIGGSIFCSSVRTPPACSKHLQKGTTKPNPSLKLTPFVPEELNARMNKRFDARTALKDQSKPSKEATNDSKDTIAMSKAQCCLSTALLSGCSGRRGRGTSKTSEDDTTCSSASSWSRCC